MLGALPYIFTLALGVVLGGFIVFKFNPKDLTINGKNKVKNGGQIDYKLEAKQENKKQRKGIFKRKKK